ncbi:MAG: hypothetical protein ACRC0M_00585 [Legionella sp.]
MKYIVYGFLALPLVALASCTVVDEQYYGSRYYTPAPQVEVQRYYPDARYNRPIQRQQHVAYKSHNAQPRVYHGHRPVRNNTIVVNPRVPRAQVEVQTNAHGHSVNPGVVVRPKASGSAIAKGHSSIQPSHGTGQNQPPKRHGHN